VTRAFLDDHLLRFLLTDEKHDRDSVDEG